MRREAAGRPYTSGDAPATALGHPAPGGTNHTVRRWTAAILVAGLLALAGGIVILTTPGSHVSGPFPPLPVPLASVLSVGESQNSTLGSHHWYNTTVLGLSAKIPLDLVGFLVQNSTGVGPFYFPWVISLLHAGSESPLATYNVTNAVWTSGGTLSLEVGEILSVDVGSAEVGGYSLVIGAGGDFAGTVSLFTFS